MAQSSRSHLHTLLARMITIGLSASLFLSCSSGDDSGSSANSAAPAAGTAVQVSVAASDPDGDQLHYRWAVTEGTINNVDAPTTTWVVPPGTGLQFAYVVVSDNKGGFTESRSAALTFDQNAAPPPAAATITPPTLKNPSGYVWGSVFYKSDKFGRNVFLPNVIVTVGGKVAITDMKGQFFISNLSESPGTFAATYEIPGASIGQKQFRQTVFVNPTSTTNYFLGEIDENLDSTALTGTVQIGGSVRQADNSFCGIRNEFFTHSSDPNLFKGPISGTVELFNGLNQSLSSKFPINHYGDFLVIRGPVILSQPAFQGIKLRIVCDNGQPIDVPLNTTSWTATGANRVPSTIKVPNNRPIVNSMSVLFNGQDVGRPDLPKPRTLFKSVGGANPTFGQQDDPLIAEIIHTPGDDAFLTYKGIDTRKSACAYYRAIGAVEGCDANGTPTGAQLTLDQWKTQFHLSPFSTPGSNEVRIFFINQADLNFARDMQAVKSGNVIAYNVCNYPGPQDVNNPLGAPKEIGTETDPDRELSIENARRGIGRVACVAMDNSAGFTKFYTFGPTGRLLLSVSLDGRREKFMPGSCTACHGGDNYGGRFPDDGSGRPDINSHWQPFDMANLFFSQQDKAKSEAAIKALNLLLVDSGVDPAKKLTTPRTQELISKWYAPNGTRATQDVTVIPSQSATQNATLYKTVVQPMCQTCHAAQRANISESFESKKICGADRTLDQNHVMTNALVPFERFWLNPPFGAGPDKINLTCTSKPFPHPAL